MKANRKFTSAILLAMGSGLIFTIQALLISPSWAGPLEKVPGTSLPAGSHGSNYWTGFFIDQKTGWFTARERIARTVDGGKTWQHVLVSNPESMFFLNKQMGWYSNRTGFYRTEDGGKDWKLIRKNVFEEAETWIVLNSLVFFNEQQGIGISGGAILQTQDGGRTWPQLYKLPMEVSFARMFFANPDQGWISGRKPGSTALILSTQDGGKSWEQTDLEPSSIRHLIFLDTKMGWAVGDAGRFIRETKTITHEGVIFRTTEGKRWERIQLPPDVTKSWFNYIYMKDEKEGWVVGGTGTKEKYFGIVMHTVDGGVTWETVATKPKTVFNYITLVEQDGKPALLVASQHQLYRMILE